MHLTSAVAVVLVALNLASPIPEVLAAEEGKASWVRELVNPVETARENIDEAQALLFRGRPLDAPRFYQLLDDAHRLVPAFDPEIAGLWRRFAIEFVGCVPTTSVHAALQMAAGLDSKLAFDDTVWVICQLVGMPPEIERLRDAKQAKENSKPASPGEHTRRVIRLVAPEGRLMPSGSEYLGHGIAVTDKNWWPRIAHQVPPDDPRGPDAPYATVRLSATVSIDGTLSDISASGPPEMVQAAKRAVMQWRIEPMTVFGHPVATAVNIEMPFGRKAPEAPTGNIPALGQFVYYEQEPQVTRSVPPIYPVFAKDAGIQGTVTVQALVGKDGTVHDATITQSIPGLDDAAIAAVRQWVFEPAKANGKPVAVWFPVQVDFLP